MFSHITDGTNDFERGAEFYDAVIVVLDHACFASGEGHRGYSQHSDNQFWALSPFDKAAAALANGGIDESAPSLRPHYHSNYYGAYGRDPAGNKLQAVCHHAED